MNLLTIKNFSKSITDKVLFKDADFSINEGEKIGVIGVMVRENLHFLRCWRDLLIQMKER